MSVNKDISIKADNKNTERATVPQKTSGRAALRKTISSYLPAMPIPLEKPTIDNDVSNLPFIERVTESLKYNVLCLEYSISPKGGLRQWVKINISLLLLFGIPILIFVPLATYFMEDFANISGLLANVTQFLLVSALNILKLIGILVAIATILYIIFKLLALRFVR